MIDKFMISDRILNSWKLNALAFDERWFWLACLAMANANPIERGALPDDDRQIDCEARVGNVEKTRAMLARLLEVGLIDVGPDGVRRPHDWDDYQAAPKFGRQTDAERARAYRERKKQQQLRFDDPASEPAPTPAPTPVPSPPPPPPAVVPPPVAAPIADDDEPFNPPAPDTLPLVESIGVNTPRQVMETRHVAMDLYGGTAVPTLINGWLASHASDRVIHALYAARDKRSPAAYIKTVLESQPPAARAAPTSAPPSNDDWKAAMRERARREEEEIERKEARRAVAAAL